MRSIYHRQSQFVIAGKGNPIDESKLQMEAGLEFAAPVVGLLSGAAKAAARTEALVVRHSYMARVGVSHGRQNRRAMFFSICVSEPDYAYIRRRSW
jgi:hypothetical protein